MTSFISGGRVLLDYVVKNPVARFLYIANAVAYYVRTDVDNWNVLYTRQELGFSDCLAVNTTIALKLGGPAGSPLQGYFLSKMGDRRALSAAIGMGAVAIPLFVYTHVTTALVVYGALFMIGFLIFGPVTLTGICVIGLAPKTVIVIVGAVPRTPGYVFSDSMAKVPLGYTIDPTRDGVTALGLHLHGQLSTFTVLFTFAAVSLACLIMVAFSEERNLRANCEFSEAKEESWA